MRDGAGSALGDVLRQPPECRRPGRSATRRSATLALAPIAALLALALPATALAADAQPRTPRADGAEGLCGQVARVASPVLPPSSTFTLQVAADGAALELAETVRGACEAMLLEGGRRPAPLASAERIVRVRLRVAGSSLSALVEVAAVVPDARPAIAATETVEAPLGPTLAAWINAAGSGLETWLAGSVDGEVLALCGADADDDGVSELALVSRDRIQFVRWTASGVEPIAQLPLTASSRPRARAPGITATCRADEGRLVATLGIHDRNVTATATLAGRDAAWLAELPGVYLGTDRGGASLIAAGEAGTGLARWKGVPLAALAATPRSREGQPMLAGAAQDGTLALADAPDRALAAVPAKALRAGTALAWADLDGDDTWELVTTRAMLPGTEGGDRLVVVALRPAPTVRHESPPVRGLLTTVGAVSSGAWWRAVAVHAADGRSHLYALGRRLPPPRTGAGAAPSAPPPR